MHAWIGFFFSCAMIVVAAMGKSGYQVLPHGIGGSPDTEFMFFLGCAGFAAALAMLAPRELVFLTDDIDRFGYTRDVYELYGAGGKFRRGYTVTQVLNSN